MRVGAHTADPGPDEVVVYRFVVAIRRRLPFRVEHPRAVDVANPREGARHADGPGDAPVAEHIVDPAEMPRPHGAVFNDPQIGGSGPVVPVRVEIHENSVIADAGPPCLLSQTRAGDTENEAGQER